MGFCKIEHVYGVSSRNEGERVVFLPLGQPLQRTQPFVINEKLPSDFTEPVSEVLKKLSVVQSDDLTVCADNLYHIKMNVFTGYMLSFELQYSGCVDKIGGHNENNFFIAIQELVNHLVTFGASLE